MIMGIKIHTDKPKQHRHASAYAAWSFFAEKGDNIKSLWYAVFDNERVWCVEMKDGSLDEINANELANLTVTR